MYENTSKELHSMSDTALSKLIGQFIKHHRIEQNKTQEDVSKSAGISRSTLSLLERGETVALSTLLRVLRVLDLLYVLDVFKVEKKMSPIEIAKMEKKSRQRASKVTYVREERPESDW